MKKSKKRNSFKDTVLYQYRGGGYDGCHWEWNYALVVDGVFHDICSSGRNSIKSLEALEERNEERMYAYDLNNHASLVEFTKESSESTQGNVIAEVNRILDSDVMFFTCTHCENDTYAKNDRPHDADYPQFFHDENNYKGNGGIGVVFCSILCEDCYCNTCEKCDSIFSPDDEEYTIIVKHEKWEDEKRVCQYCHEDHQKKAG